MAVIIAGLPIKTISILNPKRNSSVCHLGDLMYEFIVLIWNAPQKVMVGHRATGQLEFISQVNDLTDLQAGKLVSLLRLDTSLLGTLVSHFFVQSNPLRWYPVKRIASEKQFSGLHCFTVNCATLVAAWWSSTSEFYLSGPVRVHNCARKLYTTHFPLSRLPDWHPAEAMIKFIFDWQRPLCDCPEVRLCE